MNWLTGKNLYKIIRVPQHGYHSSTIDNELEGDGGPLTRIAGTLTANWECGELLEIPLMKAFEL